MDTLAVHAGASPSGYRRPGHTHLPHHLVRLPGLGPRGGALQQERSGHVYSRLSNRLCRCSRTHRGTRAWCRGSRRRAARPALHLAIATIAGAGSHIVASRALYGGSHNLCTSPCAASASRPPSSIRATAPPGVPPFGPTALLFGETLGNPGLDVMDIARVPTSPTSTRCRCWWDSTFTTPYLMRPFEHGADLIYHAATKFSAGMAP